MNIYLSVKLAKASIAVCGRQLKSAASTGLGRCILALISVWALPVLVAVTLHEAAHGFAARLFGDNTAYLLGRISLNPLKYVDPFGTVLLPGMQPRSISRSGVRPMLQVAWADVAFIVLCCFKAASLAED